MMRRLVDRPITSRLIVATLLATFLSLTVEGLSPRSAALAAGCDRAELDRAHDAFIVADFAAALETVDAMIASCSLTGELARDAYVLEARCHVGLAELDAAIEAFCRAHRLDPLWSPDPFLFTTDEIEAFRQAQSATCDLPATAPPPGTDAGSDSGSDAVTTSRGEADRPTGDAGAGRALTDDDGGGMGTWVWAAIGGGAAAVLMLVIASGGGGDDDGGEDDLPGFPPPPGN
jgi:hypothetical protein